MPSQADLSSAIMGDADGEPVAFLDRRGAAYRLIDHSPAGQPETASALPGHPSIFVAAPIRPPR
jgi:hypothetical protein